MAPDDSAQLRASIAALSDLDLTLMLTREAENYRDEALAIAKEEFQRRQLEPGAVGESSPWGSHAELDTGPSLVFKQPLSKAELPGFVPSLLVLAVVIAVEVLCWNLPGPSEEARRAALIAAAVLGFGEYLRIVAKLHRALRGATQGRYPYSPATSIVYHLIPVFNLYWIVNWPWQVGLCAESNGRARPVDRFLPGIVLLIGVWCGFYSYTSLRVALFFGAAWYTQHMLVRALERRTAAVGGPESGLAE